MGALSLQPSSPALHCRCRAMQQTLPVLLPPISTVAGAIDHFGCSSKKEAPQCIRTNVRSLSPYLTSSARLRRKNRQKLLASAALLQTSARRSGVSWACLWSVGVSWACLWIENDKPILILSYQVLLLLRVIRLIIQLPLCL